MRAVHLIEDELGANALAELLNGNSRRRPVVVVTTPAGRAEPWIDVEEVAREAGSLAEVYLMPTGAFTWGFSNRMPEGTQVYGGAGRVYPVGHEWIQDLHRSPLRFAFNEADGQKATEQLVSDMLTMAARAGLLRSDPAAPLRSAVGTVTSLVAGRALVALGNQLPAVIAPELTIEDVPLRRLLATGQQVEGLHHPDTNRIDVRASLRPAAEALAGYEMGQVVLASVAMVRNGKAELVLYPGAGGPAVTVTILRAQVTTNPADDLRTLMSVGEVVRARVAATGPGWALALNDVDDDEPVVPAPSLLPGGPPWLSEEPDEGPPGADFLEPALPAPPTSAEPSLDPVSGTVTEHIPDVDDPAEAAAPTPPRPIPTPAMFDPRRRAATAPAAFPKPQAPIPKPPPSPAAPTPVGPGVTAQGPSGGTRDLLLKIDGLAARVRKLEDEQQQLHSELTSGVAEREQLRYLLTDAERRANAAEHELRSAKSRLRKAGNRRAAPEAAPGPVFQNREQGFRYLVLTQWAIRTIPSEQAERPLGDYDIGPDFLDSLDRLEGIKPEKVADVVFEIVTGRAQRSSARAVHPLRTGPGGADPVRTRRDGATALRVSLQVNTASARRLHYWVLPNKRIELANVGVHDQMDA